MEMLIASCLVLWAKSTRGVYQGCFMEMDQNEGTRVAKAHYIFKRLYCTIGISPTENSGCFPRGQSDVTESRYPTYGACAGCFNASTINRTLTWTMGSLTCAVMLTMHAIAHGGVRTHVRDSALKVDFRGKSFAAKGNWNCVSGEPVRRSTNWATSPFCLTFCVF